MYRVFVILVGLFFSTITPASADKVIARVDLSSQTMKVYVDGKRRYSWPVSTGYGRYRTPTGRYSAKFLKRMHYSSKYNNSPMPYSVFFHGGYAIHGTRHTRHLGRPASHGCVRLRTSNAAKLYKLVRRHGRANMRVVIKR